MNESIREQKQKLRSLMLHERRKLTTDFVREAGHAFLHYLDGAGIIADNSVFHLYYPINNEADTRPLITRLLALNKTVVMPRTNFDLGSMDTLVVYSFEDLEITRFGMHEPKLDCERFDNDPDVVIVPGAAFDREGNRIGYGKGFYDGYLAFNSARKIALAYDFQVLEHIPHDPHDIKMDMIVTDTNLINISQ